MGVGNKRQANFELLRIVAMLMIITLHYLVKGGVIAASNVPLVIKENPTGAFAWLIEAFCIVAVNCYVLISGYFGVESVWKPGRVISLLCQVLFYSLSVPCVLLLIGAESAKKMELYDWIDCVLPIETEHYWFATAYLIMYLFAPLLSIGIRQMEKRQLQLVIVFLLGFFSLGKTIFPVYLVTDRSGYDFGWLMCLFVVAGYIRMYGIPWLEKLSHAAAAYLLSSFGIWLFALFVNLVASKFDVSFTHYINMLYAYNHLLCLISAVALFYLFKNLRIREGRFADAVRRLAPYTFGVYLLHEHNLVRYEWMTWLGVEKVNESFWFIPHMIGCVLLVYVIGTAVDAARAWLFARVTAAVRGGRKQ